MICPNCGSQLNDASKFCIYCGTPIDNQPLPPVAPVAPNYAPEAQGYAPYGNPAPYANDQFVYVPDANNAPGAAPAKKKGNAKKIIIPIVAVIVAAAVALGVYFGFFANQKYYMSTLTMYEYDEDGEVLSTTKYAFYGKFIFPLETSRETEDMSGTMKFVLDDDNKIIELRYKYENKEDESENESYSIDIEYEEEDGKQVGKGSRKNDDGEKETFEIVYEGDDNFTVTIKTDGELDEEFHCYINEDGYCVMEEKGIYSKNINIYDGSKPIESKSYRRDDENDEFELTSSTTSTYNKAGYLIEKVSKYNYDDEESTYKTVYERNKNNVPTSITWYEDGEKVKYTKIDEENDDSIVLEVFDEDDESIGFLEYGFKGKKLTYAKEFDEDKNLTSETTYNKQGLAEESISYDSDGNKTGKTVYEYEKR